MEASFTFTPKPLTPRIFKLFETDDFFILIGTDKLTKVAQVLQIRRLPDTH